jgi:SNF2 family DNA or RNA helicase
MEIVDNKVLVLRTRNPQKYAIIPKSKVLRKLDAETYEVAVRWGLDEVCVLRNLGVNSAPSPVLREYVWPGRYTPFKHQVDTTAFLTLHRKAFVFSEPGTGKTLSALWAADYLMSLGLVRRCLVLCPLSIMQVAWMRDITNSIVHRSAVVCHHQKAEKRREMVANGYEFVISNYDGLPLIYEDVLKDGTFDLIIADEANAYKNATIRRWKTLAKLVGPHTRLWMMTGTPAAQSPLDAFGLAKLVNPAGVPKYPGAWRDKVMQQLTRFKWIPKPDAHDMVHAALQPAIRFTKAECLDLPPVLTETREVPLTPQQLKYYNLLKKQLTFDAAGETVTAVNAADGVNKLLQISAGAAYTADNEVIEFDCSPRLNVLQEILEETSRKVLVFTHFRHSMHVVSDFLTKEGVAHEMIHGDVTPTKRALIFNDFQNTDRLKVLLIQPQAAQHGVTLTAADTVVFWGPVTSVETYIQCVARSDRQGQVADKVTVIHMQGSDIERKLFDRLAKRVEDHSMLLKIYEEELAPA